ncbi:hypothetical protein E4Z66_12535 [Aliishimia ponticola]|uniref:Uncharacterized protein n=1 Tax=Aliishimia ponticola TaxID=2499833 RepID=A0A4S4N9G7_9RHOB|nr:hypothetical protein [Aliishimia ponticola]THH35894.1 hypothetical protein E4Z66_12535 [Aliishimia ponticola]
MIWIKFATMVEACHAGIGRTLHLPDGKPRPLYRRLQLHLSSPFAGNIAPVGADAIRNDGRFQCTARGPVGDAAAITFTQAGLPP